jgi:hypothetical protein
MIDREPGWLRETAKELEPGFAATVSSDKNRPADGDTRNSERIDGLVQEAFLRTLSRAPTASELAESRQSFQAADSPMSGMRNLLWALLNTKEFIVNH